MAVELAEVLVTDPVPTSDVVVDGAAVTEVVEVMEVTETVEDWALVLDTVDGGADPVASP